MAESGTDCQLDSLSLCICLWCISQHTHYLVLIFSRNVFIHVAASFVSNRLFTIKPAIDISTVAYFPFRNILTISILNFLWTLLDIGILFPLHTDFHE